ncbi:LOW QUALITY PROTEIN: leucine-rich repeat-containing G-protein coupled receptor 6 [Hippopotamus amphibius kiboko]|uniref:LOW QUALITY PROTEIN: leucine-rich repeat-containing G-protein coupled receptor 6 n=1 Tax=Hippopotamus amphibius kiboko TaxID=575201 RepID=UPI002598D162|nr:LOW QUALITY PROTEIN: leucine-rich repeat-containing G-protein coupled receptor 6 [Hippopotamus amphibius kiboko]
MSGTPALCALWLCAALCAAPCTLGAPPPGPRPACPAPCRCQEAGIALWADCSELGLSAVPADLDPLTASLDLSMNNLSALRPGLFRRLRFLEELRLSGNRLSHIPGQAFSGLYSLKILMLQDNQLGAVPAAALRELPSLRSLRLDANLIARVPERSFEGLPSLRHLWLDDNALTEIPVRALGSLRALQAVTLALNRIARVPDFAFQNLSSLVVLHLHNNRIQSLGTHSFAGLHSLETLDLNDNQLHEFPVAIRTLGRLQELGFHNNNIKAIPEKAFLGNPLLQTIHFYDNPIQFVGRSAFRHLPRLHTLSLNGAADTQEFPDLKGTRSLEILTLTRAGLRRLPPGVCQQLPRLRVLELSHNQIQGLPSLRGCQELQEIGLQHNRISEIRADTFRQLTSLQALDLSWNAIRAIHPEAFVTLRSLVKLDLTGNQLTVLPLAGLGGLVHLKLKGNRALSQAFPKDSFPKLRTLEVPYAYQCCSYGTCPGFFKASGQWGSQDPHPDDQDAPKRPLGLLAGRAASRYEVDPAELQLEVEDPRPHAPVQCSPVPGPFKPCEHLLESWGVRLAVWAVVLLAVVCNGLVLLSLSAAGPAPCPPVKFVVGAIAGANALTGLSRGLLALVDALTFGRFAEYGARWETGPGCRAAGFLAVLGSEASVLLLTLAAVHGSVAVAGARARGKAPAPGSLRLGALGCLALAGLAAALPLASVGEYGASPLCLPYAPPDGRPAALGFSAALALLNACCFLAVAAAYVKLSCDLPGAELEAAWDCAALRHVAWLAFADGLLYCPVAFLSLASALGLFPITPEAVKSVLLLVLPLPACLNPLLYLLFSPHCREDLRRLRPRPGVPGHLALAAAGQLEPSSCDSTQALVAFSDVELIPEASEAGWPAGLETYGFPLVTLAPHQQPGGPRPERGPRTEPAGTRFGNRPLSVDGGALRGAEGAVQAGGGWLAGRGFQASGLAPASHL